MDGKRAAIGAALFGTRPCGHGVLLIVGGLVRRDLLLDVLERQQQLLGIKLLRAPAEQNQRWRRCGSYRRWYRAWNGASLRRREASPRNTTIAGRARRWYLNHGIRRMPEALPTISCRLLALLERAWAAIV